jgi:hypothetical protein
MTAPRNGPVAKGTQRQKFIEPPLFPARNGFKLLFEFSSAV